jgi:hypothetical protein
MKYDTTWASFASPRDRATRDGEADVEGHCVLYWMLRAQRGMDNAPRNPAIER